jgi:hypothetical protein
MSWGIDQRRAAEHDQASTAAYISGLRDYGWNGDVDSVKFARATAAALNAGTWLAMEASWLCPDMAEPFGSDDAAWPTRVAAKQGISTTTVVEARLARDSFVSEPHLPAVVVGKALNGAPLDLDAHAVPGLLGGRAAAVSHHSHDRLLVVAGVDHLSFAGRCAAPFA